LNYENVAGPSYPRKAHHEGMPRGQDFSDTMGAPRGRAVTGNFGGPVTQSMENIVTHGTPPTVRRAMMDPIANGRTHYK